MQTNELKSYRILIDGIENGVISGRSYEQALKTGCKNSAISDERRISIKVLET